MVKEIANKDAVKAVAEVKPVEAAKKEEVKKAAAPKAGKIIFEFDGQQIDLAAIQKKAAKLSGDVYVVAGEKKIYDKDGKAVELF